MTSSSPAIMPSVELPLTRSDIRDGVFDTVIAILSAMPWWFWIVLFAAMAASSCRAVFSVFRPTLRYAGRSMLFH